MMKQSMMFSTIFLFVYFKTHIGRSEKSVKDHQDHHDALQAAVDWLTLMKDRLSTCSDTTGDRHTLQNKLDRVKVSYADCCTIS